MSTKLESGIVLSDEQELRLYDLTGNNEHFNVFRMGFAFKTIMEEIDRPILFRHDDNHISNGDFLQWNGKYWQTYHTDHLNNDLSNLFRNFNHRAKFHKEAIDSLKMVMGIAVREGRFNQNPKLVLDNGVLSINENKLIFENEFHKEDFCTFSLDVQLGKYDISKWQECLDQLLPDIKDQRALQEMFGCCFFPSYRPQVFFILFGEAHTGKGTVVNVLSELLGVVRISGQSGSSLGRDFGLQPLSDKFVNFCGEFEKIDEKSEIMLKQITGGDLCCIDRKWREHLQRVINCKLIFASNRLPQFTDRTDAIWSRMVIIPFQRQIRNIIVDYHKILLKERNGIFLWAMGGLQRLLNRGGGRRQAFTQSNIANEMLEQHKKECFSEVAWYEQYVVLDTGAYMPIGHAYEHYRKQSDNDGKKPLSKDRFTKRIKEFMEKQGLDTAPVRPRNIPDRMRCWQGVKLVFDN